MMYFTTGKVTAGQCAGDKVTIVNVSLVKKGNCKLRSGVTQILSHYALLNMRGKCQATCFGDVSILSAPGIRN